MIGALLSESMVSCWNLAPAGLTNPSISSAASLPYKNPPLHIVSRPLEVSEMVAYNPSPTLRTDAKPLSTTGVCATRESAASDSARFGNGISGYAASNALHCEARFKNDRREKFDPSISPPEQA